MNKKEGLKECDEYTRAGLSDPIAQTKDIRFRTCLNVSGSKLLRSCDLYIIKTGLSETSNSPIGQSKRGVISIVSISFSCNHNDEKSLHSESGDKSMLVMELYPILRWLSDGQLDNGVKSIFLSFVLVIEICMMFLP